jgi:8-oxo-dGTP pyrophosphatase MutT (NUDIX family)
MEYVKTMRSLIGHRPLQLIGSNVLIFNKEKQLLLQQRTNGAWGLPGGLMEINETLEETARREVLEETGLTIDKLELIGVFSGPPYFFTLPNQDQIYVVTAVYVTTEVKGEIVADGVESKQVKYFPLSDLPSPVEEEYMDYIRAFQERFPSFDSENNIL